MAEKEECQVVVVVGMNRPRLSKIIGLVEEKQQRQKSPEQDVTLRTEVVPCLAAMGSYKNESGESVRYMEGFVALDGSPMTKYFDDSDFRDSLEAVLMVGYEWHAGDIEHIGNYFKANNLAVPVECVQPKPEFKTLRDEMQFFKGLDEAEKEQCATQQTMGPAKMARFVFETTEKKREERLAEIKTEIIVPDVEKEGGNDTGIADEVESTPSPEPADPNRTRYACRICRTILLGENHLAKGHVQNLHSFRRANFNAHRPTTQCQSIFCAESVLEWLSPNGQDVEGKLTCPKCTHKIGHWKWSGAQCSCGTWVTPAIQIPISKVDEVFPVSTASGLERVAAPVVIPPILPVTPHIPDKI